MARTNLLAGRAVRREMHPLQPDKMGADSNTADGIEAMPAMHFAQGVLAGRIWH